jgi:uncharacterized FlgJ-related protein
MTNPFVAGRIPPDLHEKLNEFCIKSGKSKTEVFIEALAEYLEYTLTGPVKPRGYITTEEFEKALNEIRQEIAQLKQAHQHQGNVDVVPPLKDFFASTYEKHYKKNPKKGREP